MKKEVATWQFVKYSFLKKKNVVLLYVLQSTGSSPGRAGFFMAVNADDEICGSIGGGIMEHKFVEMARVRLKENIQVSKVYQQIHDKIISKNQSGMICSGQQVTWMYSMDMSDEELVNNLINCYDSCRTTLLEMTASGIRLLPFQGKERTAGLTGFNVNYEGIHNNDKSDESWRYIQLVGYVNQLHVIGGGHCALALSEIMSKMDFYIHVYDTRPGLNTFYANGYAHLKTTIGDYKEIGDLIPGSIHDYVVIMTIGYRTDDVVLRSLFNKNLAYIGCLGSRKKIEKMFDGYRKEGIGENILKKIHAPVGIQIDSQTPEEIAVSIAAQIIMVKNGL